MKFQALLMAILLVAMMSLGTIGCRHNKETTIERTRTQVNPISGTETVEKETTTKSK